jgi:hypothetical protein
LAWTDLGDAGVLDAEFFAKQFGFVLAPVVVGGQADPSVDAVGSPAAGIGGGEVG